MQCFKPNDYKIFAQEAFDSYYDKAFRSVLFYEDIKTFDRFLTGYFTFGRHDGTYEEQKKIALGLYIGALLRSKKEIKYFYKNMKCLTKSPQQQDDTNCTVENKKMIHVLPITDAIQKQFDRLMVCKNEIKATIQREMHERMGVPLPLNSK